jgi:acetyl-CoA decarbonylase/synthase complex subunit beta
MRDKIATDEDVTDVTQLAEFMKKVNHPMVAKWAAEEEVEEEVAEAAAPEAAAIPMMQPGMMPQMQLPAFAPPGGAAGGIKLVLKNANINVEKIILKKKE